MIKFVVVGCGHIGKRHVQVIAEAKNAQLMAVCDINEDTASNLGEKYRVPFYTDYTEMLANIDTDVVTIATPHGLHAEMSIQASQAGRAHFGRKTHGVTHGRCSKYVTRGRKKQHKSFLL